jgi:PIN domain nuclease of toxin-antitoxin system
MKFLIDTQLLVWAAIGSAKLPQEAIRLMGDGANDLHFSVASLWEITIKRGLGRNDFRIDPVRLRHGLLANGYTELTITAAHALGIGELPLLHKDPFDRLLLSQARAEGFTLLTTDAAVANYPGPIRHV